MEKPFFNRQFSVVVRSNASKKGMCWKYGKRIRREITEKGFEDNQKLK